MECVAGRLSHGFKAGVLNHRERDAHKFLQQFNFGKRYTRIEGGC